MKCSRYAGNNIQAVVYKLFNRVFHMVLSNVYVCYIGDQQVVQKVFLRLFH